MRRSLRQPRQQLGRCGSCFFDRLLWSDLSKRYPYFEGCEDCAIGFCDCVEHQNTSAKERTGREIRKAIEIDWMSMSAPYAQASMRKGTEAIAIV